MYRLNRQIASAFLLLLTVLLCERSCAHRLHHHPHQHHPTNAPTVNTHGVQIWCCVSHFDCSGDCAFYPGMHCPEGTGPCAEVEEDQPEEDFISYLRAHFSGAKPSKHQLAASLLASAVLAMALN